MEKKYYSVDQKKLMQYFPLQKVIKGMFLIYENLLGLKFVKLENAEVTNGCMSTNHLKHCFQTWHEDVKLYQVNDKASGETMGFFFTDLHARDGKSRQEATGFLQPVILLSRTCTLWK